MAAGIALRLYRLGEQILTGDELHTLNGALARGMGEILRTWTYHGADYCVPLTLAVRALMDAGVVVTEWWLRAPSLLSSLALLALFPWAMRRRLGDAPAVCLAWLLALSPMLVLYGRIVRSYAPLVLLSAGAALAFDRFWRRGSRAAGAAFVLMGAAAVHFHLGALPFVAAPFAFAGAHTLRDWSGRKGRLPELLVLAVLLAGLVAALLFPARASLLELMGIHGGGRAPIVRTWLEVARLQAGTASVPLAVALFLALLRGAWLLWLRDRDFALYLGTLAAVHVVGLVALEPNFLQAAIVANRYVLPLLPFSLALVALGLTTPLRGRDPRWQAAFAAALVLAVFARGPLASAEYRWSSFTHAQPFVLLTRPGDRIPASRVPRFYRELPDGDEPIVEAPWTNVGTHSFNAYQRIHRRPLRVASVSPEHFDPRIALRNTPPADVDALLRSGARYLVVHLDLRSEEQFVETYELRHAERVRELKGLWASLRRSASHLAGQLEVRLGEPTYEDEVLRVWDLEAVSPAARRTP